MKKYKRIQRIGILIKIFTEKPNKIFSYNYFSELFNAAKSTISEDISIVKNTFEEMKFGTIKTLTGVSGGAIYIPDLTKNQTELILNDLCNYFSNPDRIIPSGFVYMTDLFNTPSIVEEISKVIVSKYKDEIIDYIVTVETKGIPIAMMCGQKLNVPVAVIRRNSRVTEGATVSINYLSGSSNNIQTMSLSKRSLKSNSNVLIVDDFMKGGGTAKGMKDLMEEFSAKVVGIAVVVETKKPSKKLVDNYLSLLIFDEIEYDNKVINISPNNKLLQ